MLGFVPQPNLRKLFVLIYQTHVNMLLSEFVHANWNLQNAAAVSPSLKRTLDRLTYMKEIESDK